MDASPTNDDAAAWAGLDFWKELAGGDDDSARELLTLFLRDTSAQISLVVSGLAAGDADEVCRAAHTCVGSSATCGLDSLAELFRQLEREAADRSLDALSHTVPLIVETFDQVHVRLTKAIAASLPATIQERS
jgi:HPt (histidine-containing phosphotransfer) domain-containing protein